MTVVNEETAATEPVDGSSTPSTERPAHVPKTRAGTTWVGICLTAVLAIGLVVFLAQNTQRVHVSFLWMDVATPLALALLIAAVAAALLTAIVGTARILQLRRNVHQNR